MLKWQPTFQIILVFKKNELMNFVFVNMCFLIISYNSISTDQNLILIKLMYLYFCLF